MRNRRRRDHSEQPEAKGAPAWSFTYGNLVTVLLAFFILFARTSGVIEGGSPQAPAEGQAAKVVSLGTIKRRIEARLQELNAPDIVRFESEGGALIIRMDAGRIFDSGRAEFKPEAIPALDAVGGVLGSVGNQLRVEGHSDSDPVIPTAQLPDNWALSSQRAGGVLRYLREFYGIEGDRVAMAGYADTRPIASNGSAAGKARNRRVDIVVLAR